MPCGNARSHYGIFGRRISRFFAYRKARRMFGEISKALNFFETKFIKNRLHHAQ